MRLVSKGCVNLIRQKDVDEALSIRLYPNRAADW